ncbi:hypothetical protein [Streptomyces sp. NPDC005485]|uniref:hypothetical protein n=1 Tax=Streptomyces sp. NPDC005485 TaxID=3155591 RepID=UPI0033A2C8E3
MLRKATVTFSHHRRSVAARRGSPTSSTAGPAGGFAGVVLGGAVDVPEPPELPLVRPESPPPPGVDDEGEAVDVRPFVAPLSEPLPLPPEPEPAPGPAVDRASDVAESEAAPPGLPEPPGPLALLELSEFSDPSSGASETSPVGAAAET